MDFTDQLISATRTLYNWFNMYCQVLILAVPVYYLLKYLRHTSGFRTLVGAAISVIVLHSAAKWLRFYEVSWLLEYLIRYLPLAFVVVFQTELRRLFADFGAKKIARDAEKARNVADEIVSATMALSGMKIGALMAVEGNGNLEGYAKNGRHLNAPVNAELIANIFFPNAPLHDGGMIIRNGEIFAASCSFPLTATFNQTRLPFGQRHRAAIGLSEETDALILVVSEETGLISIAYKGELVRGIDRDALAKIIEAGLASGERDATGRTLRDVKENKASLGDIDKVAAAMTKLKESD